MKDVKRTLYKLPDLPFAGVVIVTEGEKDADRVNSLGFKVLPNRSVALDDAQFPFEQLPFREIRVVATTSGGTETWQDSFADLLAYSSDKKGHPSSFKRYVVVVPDSDEAGQKYKERIIHSLSKRAIPHCVVSFNGFKDVSDYLDGGHSGAELARLISDELTKIGAGAVTCAEEVPEQFEEISI